MGRERRIVADKRRDAKEGGRGQEEREREERAGAVELREAEREVERLEEEGEDEVATEAARTEVPTFSEEEREALSGMEFAVCVGRFYSELAERLLNGAVEGFADGGVSLASIHTYDVPGSFELPLAAKLCAESGSYAGIACLGAVIRGETDHYDYVCAETARGVQQVAISTGVPCAFGVITCDTIQQALARSGGDRRDQGRGAALTVMRMALLAAELR
jgi:6,7-dimethyl-8-ribityllumazine synthase